MFASKLNCVTGQMEWIVTGKDIKSEDADFSEEFSRSHFGDMLHDTERNKKYELGLKWAISELLSKGIEPRVLDIGSGTGLLAMMAARNGAQNITAIEVFKPMVKILKEVIRENGFHDKINVVSKHSTDVIVGSDGDMQQRANILVTEVFDSELIGEGAIPTFRHAHQNLLEKEALVIPSTGIVYIQLLQSDFLSHSHSLDVNKLPVNVNVPATWTQCMGPSSLWDIHLEEVAKSYDVIPLSEPCVIAKFSFDDPDLPICKKYKPVSVIVNKSGSCSAFAIWWSITFAPGVELSMSPWQQNLQWRDHWLPCVQVLPRPLELSEGLSLEVQATNDEYTMWAAILNNDTISCTDIDPTVPRPVCSCGVHLAWSRSRIRMMNDNHRNNQFMSAINKIICQNISSVLCVSDGTLLPVMCSQIGRDSPLKKIFLVENNKHSYKSCNELIQATPLPVPIQLINKSPPSLTWEDVSDTPIEAFIAEPFFITTSLPWDNLYYWYIRSSLVNLMTPNVIIMPCKGYLKAIAVTFQDLHLLKAYVKTVEELNITAYDKAVDGDHAKPNGESLDPEGYPLWEYPCYPLSSVQTLMTFDFTQCIPFNNIKVEGSFSLTDSAHSSPCHGVVLWMEYQLLPNDNTLLSEGLLEPPCKGSKLVWSSAHNEGVCFFMEYNKTDINYSVNHQTNTGEINFKFY